MLDELATHNPFSENPADVYFVGRDEQLEVFRSALADLQAGSPGHIFVGGLDGTGKTSFLTRLKSIADASGLAGCKIKIEPPDSAIPNQAFNNMSAIIRGTAARLDEAPCASSSNLVADWDKASTSPTFRQCRVTELRTDLAEHDLSLLVEQAVARSLPGIVLCIDEGQWLAPGALSALKNALQDARSYLVVLSLRIAALDGDAVTAARALLDKTALEASGDIGASRFFITPLEMGPFATTAEAERCVTLRLQTNQIQFGTTVIRDIVQLADRSPGKIINYASAVYLTARQAGATLAMDSHLAEVARRKNRIQIEHATALVADLSPTARKTVRRLAMRDDACSPASLRRDLYPELDCGLSEGVEQAILGHLAQFADRARSCQRDSDDRFSITDPLERFCLRLAFDDN